MAKKKKKVKKVKTRKLKVKAKPKARRKVKAIKRKDGRRKAALILSIIAIAILITNVIYNFTARETILTSMRQTLSELPAETLGKADIEAVSNILPTALITLTVIWLVLAALMIWTASLLEKKRGKWYLLLILGIIIFLNGKWLMLSGILAIISSVLYKR